MDSSPQHTTGPRGFISYIQADEEAAERLTEELKQRNLPLLSIHHLAIPDDSWFDQLEEILSQSNVVFFLVSPASAESQWLSAEMALALSHVEEGHTRVVPVFLDKKTRPPELLRGIQGIEFYNPERAQHQLDALVQSLQAGHSPPHPPLAACLRTENKVLAIEKKLHRSKTASRSWKLIGSLLLALLVASAFVLFSNTLLFFRSGPPPEYKLKQKPDTAMPKWKPGEGPEGNPMPRQKPEGSGSAPKKSSADSLIYFFVGFGAGASLSSIAAAILWRRFMRKKGIGQ